MVVYVLSRTDYFGEKRRILEGAYDSYDKAEAARQEMLKRYNAPSKLCYDTEIQKMEVR